jgi:hypothetical protein
VQITFTRISQYNYRTVVVRDDRVIVEIPYYGRTKWLPHDLAHYVIEFNLSLTEGFWGRIAAGAIYPPMKVLEGRQPPHATDRSKRLIQANSPQGAEAEALVGWLVDLTQKQLDTDWSEVQTMVTRTGQIASTKKPALTAIEIKQICAKLREMQQQWSELAVGESINLTWPLSLASKA